ncbi:MAG TPA: HIT domain-containing protein [Rhizomicrobium sp.]|jgi:diadenosine tetraphosphate (Ap4A) HIT family hydrolase|nr:HIT domain-containing protein [Rhizomicrobium sp.]
MFELHPRLEDDTIFVADWPLSRVLLMNDRRFPWLVMVPRREDLRELHDLLPEDGATLMQEVARASRTLKMLTSAAKMNIGALGNLVPQLHIHIIARALDDAAWPGPVWGCGAAVPYATVTRDAFLERLESEL